MATSEQVRLEALHELGLMDTPAEERFDRVVRLAKRLFDVPMVAVNLLDADRLYTKSGVGLPSGASYERELTFCTRMVDTHEPMVVTDTNNDRDWAENPYVTGDPFVRFYAGQPLAAPGGEVVGSLCLVGEQPREMTEGDRHLLQDLARWVEYELATDADEVQAKEIQRRLLPRSAPIVPGYDIAGRCQPAMHVGGDYYDWHLLDGTMLQVTVADVMGKGLAAGVIAAGIRTALRVTSRSYSLTESVRRTAAGLQEDFNHSETFATMFTARLRPQHGHLEYVDAGHGLALIVSPDREPRHLSAAHLPLGTMPDDTWDSRVDRLEPGETLIIVSDGVLDVYPEPEAAIAAARRLVATNQKADEMADRILAAGARAPLADDLTAVVIRRERDS